VQLVLVKRLMCSMRANLSLTAAALILPSFEEGSGNGRCSAAGKQL